MANSLHAHRDTVIVFPSHQSIDDLASDCREAAMTFLRESQHWGKAELATWLASTSIICSREGGSLFRLDDVVSIDAALIDRVIKQARADVLAALEDKSAAFVFTAIAMQNVVRCRDGADATGWAPRCSSPRLADRVLSLFAVDYLTRPNGFYNGISLCRSCGHVEMGTCVNRTLPPTTKSRRNTLPYFYFPDQA